jgi:hypothetical protein
MSLEPRSLQRKLAAAAMLALLACIAITATQCRQVEDNLLGIRVTTPGGAGSCITACARAYNDSIKVENAIHKTNEESCGDDTTCLALEELRHENELERLLKGRKQCQDQCHHQGGGSGGF